jgi:hypothetical protein
MSNDGMKLHIGYYDMNHRAIADAEMMGRGLMEKLRLARTMCACLNKAHVYTTGQDTVKPYIWGMTTCTAEIREAGVDIFDCFFGAAKCECFDVGETWEPAPLPDYFVKDMRLVLDSIEKNQHDD